MVLDRDTGILATGGSRLLFHAIILNHTRMHLILQIQNSSDDLYSLFRFLKLQPYCWWNKFNNDLSVQPKKNKTGPYRSLDDRMQKLQAILQCCLLRRTKSTRIDGSSEPLIKLPEREISQDQPDFTEIERELYTGLEQRNLRRFEKMVGAGSLERHYRSILVMIMRSMEGDSHAAVTWI